MGDLLRGFPDTVFHPPHKCGNEGGADVVDPKAFRQFFGPVCIKNPRLTPDQPAQLLFKVIQKQFIAPAGQKIQNMIIIFLQVPEQMQKHCVGVIAVKYVTMGIVIPCLCFKYMGKQFPAQILQKKLLCFKMGVKGGSSHICSGNDLSYRDLVIAFFGQKLDKSFKNGSSGFSLASVHNCLHTNFPFCSVIYKTEKPPVVPCDHQLYYIAEQVVYYHI